MELWKYCVENPNIKFDFIGKNVPDMFKDVPIIGPYVKEELAGELNKYHTSLHRSQKYISIVYIPFYNYYFRNMVLPNCETFFL